MMEVKRYWASGHTKKRIDVALGNIFKSHIIYVVSHHICDTTVVCRSKIKKHSKKQGKKLSYFLRPIKGLITHLNFFFHFWKIFFNSYLTVAIKSITIVVWGCIK